MTRPPPPPAWPRRHPARAAAAAGVALAVLLLHAALLDGLPRAPVPLRAAGLPALQLRQIRLAPSPATAPPRPAPPLPAPPARTATEPAAPRPAAAQAHADAAPPADRAPPDPAADEAGDEARRADPAPAPAGLPLPVYATRLPPAATLQYVLHREGARVPPGRAELQAELRWRPAAEAYTLSLGFGATGWASVGGLDLHGIAPERHVETRRGRELRAANFRREAGPGGGRITYSGPPVEHPLLPGAQDRLSWLLQLAAVLEADPALGQPGREVQLFVAGVRGDAAVWTFTVQARAATELPAGPVAEAVHLRRQAQHRRDTEVDVWLDPARHHLPVRLRLHNRAGGPGAEGASTDFRLSQLSLP